MRDEVLMTRKEFQENLSEFMDYMRRMEDSMSKNWDEMHRFQEAVKQDAKNLIASLTSHERIADFSSVTEGIKTQVKDGCATLQKGIDFLLQERTDFERVITAEKSDRRGWLNDLNRTLKRYELIKPEELAMKGALQALRYVEEFKEAYDYLQKVKGVLTSKELPNFGYFPQGVNPAFWNLELSKLEVSVRTGNCFRVMDISTVGELAQLNEADLLRVRNMGKFTIKEIKKILSDMGLTLGMKDA